MNRKNIMILMISLSLVLLLGSSYAMLRSTAEGKNPYVINVGTLQVSFEGSTDKLSLENMYPMSDTEGSSQSEELVFVVKNTGNIEARYNVYLEEISTDPEFKNYIRFISNKDSEGYNEPKTMGYDKYIDLEARLDATKSASYKVKVWLDQDAENEYMDKTFTAKVVIEGNQIDASNTLYTKINNAIKEHSGTTIVEDGVTYLSGTNEMVNYNYVWYSGKLWRITSINSDGTIKMVTNDVITAIQLSKTNDFENSYTYQFLNEDFKDTLYNNKNIIEENAKWNVTVQEDFTNKIPETKTISGVVGLLNAYEYYQSYKKTTDKEGYLNTNLYRWFLLTLYNTEGGIFRVDENGTLQKVLSYPSGGIRPSIVLKTNVELLNGDGSLSNPYLIKGDKNFDLKNIKLNTRLSGEYVKFDNSIYRIVNIQNETSKPITKLVKADDLEIIKALTKESEYYGDSANIAGDYWDYYLNNDWYNSIALSYKNMMVKGTYYLGPFNRNSYKMTICSSEDLNSPIKNCEKVSKTWTGYVGVLRVGELFAINTKSTRFWLISPESSRKVYDVSEIGTLDPFDVSTLKVIRPVITLSSDVIITGGDGISPETAFEVSLP